MKRLLLTASVSTLLLLAFGQPIHSAPTSESSPASLAISATNSPLDNSVTQTAALSVSQIPATWNNGRPIMVVEHEMPSIDLKAHPRIASDLAAALREPSFVVFAAAITFLLGMAATVLHRTLR